MAKVTGFLEYERNDRDYEPVEERVRHWREFILPLKDDEYRIQAARCMNCGVPYCQGTGSLAPGTPGCPVNNQIPDWNDLVYTGNWDEAARNLHSTNNFPEVTGRVCPAPCEASCTLNIDENPVTIKSIECAIADRAIAQGLKPEPATERTGKRVAVVGSGPAGLACAQQLARGPRGSRLRKIRQGRRAAPLRDSRLQDGEASRRPPRRANGGRGRSLPLQRPCRRESRC
jgi:glutamate synthase (NADPH/NADH) small chain